MAKKVGNPFYSQNVSQNVSELMPFFSGKLGKLIFLRIVLSVMKKKAEIKS